MNRREREAVCGMIAAWEWATGGSSSSADARARCAEDLIRVLDLGEAELQWARTYHLFTLLGELENDGLFDALDDLVEDEGYQGVVDRVEELGVEGLAAHLKGTIVPRPATVIP